MVLPECVDSIFRIEKMFFDALKRVPDTRIAWIVTEVRQEDQRPQGGPVIGHIVEVPGIIPV